MSSKGFYHQADKRIVVKEGMGELQSIKTLIHEIAHSKLHDRDRQKESDIDMRTKEVQAESIAYTVCQHFGLNTSNYSFAYLTSWSSGRELPELKASLETIRSTASDLIKDIERNFAELTKDKEQAQADFLQKPKERPSVIGKLQGARETAVRTEETVKGNKQHQHENVI